MTAAVVLTTDEAKVVNAPSVAPELPVVHSSDAYDDVLFFREHPERNFRVRDGVGGRWAVRRRPGEVFLRTPLTGAPLPDEDLEAGAALSWWANAYPEMPPKARQKMAAKTCNKAGAKRRPPIDNRKSVEGENDRRSA